jgi:hypothetical protein
VIKVYRHKIVQFCSVAVHPLLDAVDLSRVLGAISLRREVCSLFLEVQTSQRELLTVFNHACCCAEVPEADRIPVARALRNLVHGSVKQQRTEGAVARGEMDESGDSNCDCEECGASGR